MLLCNQKQNRARSMVDHPGKVGNEPPLPEPPSSGGKREISGEETQAFSKLNTSEYPDPFPGMQMTNKEKQQFWTTFVTQMNQVLQHEAKRAEKALKELKKKIEEGD